MDVIRPIRKSTRSRVFWLGDTDKVINLYKYMNIEHAFDFLKSGILYFAEPTVWKDPYERRFYDADYSALDYRQTKLFCACFTDRPDNEAAWKMYSRGGDSALASRCMQYRLSKRSLLNNLSAFAGENKCTVYIGHVNYGHDKYIIDTLHTLENSKYEHFFSQFDLEKYLNLLLIKRKDFEYEKEIRVFIVPDDQEGYKKSDIGIMDRSGKGLICPVKIQDHINDLVFSCTIDPNCTGLESDMIKAMFDNYLSKDKKCKLSGLYSPQKRITIEK